MHTSSLLVAVGLGVAIAGCAGQKDLVTWSQHPTHFASGTHLAFSARHGNGGEVPITEADLAKAAEEGWWGDLVPPAPPADVAGHWTGQWSGRSTWGGPRGSWAEVRLTQSGAHGRGRLQIADAQAVESVPYAMRLAGSEGVPVSLEVRESEVWLRHASPDGAFLAVLTVDGDRLVGRFRGLPAGATLVLARAK